MFRIRIDEKSGLNVVDFIESIGATTYVLVHHVLPHGNPHYHAYVETEIKEQTLRQRIKRNGYVASEFSLKKCDNERKNEYIQYLFNQKHDNVPNLIKSYNFPSELLDRLQIQARDVAEEFSRNKTIKRNSRPTIFELAKEITEKYNEKYPQKTVNNLGTNWTNSPDGYLEYKYHLELAIEVCNKYNQAFEENYLRRLVTTALCNRESGKKIIISNILAKVFPHN